MKKDKRRSGIQLNQIKGNHTILAVLAFVLAVCVMLVTFFTGYQVARCLHPVSVLAKESFTGINGTVEEHDEENPYKILDIVPSSAYYDMQTEDGAGDITGVERYRFSTGTMGYLASGQTALAEDLTAVFENPAFRSLADREALFSKVVVDDAVHNFPGLTYEEAYGGVHDIANQGPGWELLFDSQYIDDVTHIDTAALAGMREGMFLGSYQKIGAGEDVTGYDYVALGDSETDRPGTESYEYDADGEWHLVFSAVEQPQEDMNLYEAENVLLYDIGSYSYATGLYCLDENGKYQYVGTVAQIIYGKEDDYFGEPGECDNPDNDQEPEEADKDTGSGGDGNTADNSVSGEDTGAGAGGSQNTEGDGEPDIEGGDSPDTEGEGGLDIEGGDSPDTEGEGSPDIEGEGGLDIEEGDSQDTEEDGSQDTEGIGTVGKEEDSPDDSTTDGENGRLGIDTKNMMGTGQWRRLVERDDSGNMTVLDKTEDEAWEPVENLDREYYVVVFKQVKELSAANGDLYQVERREQIKGNMRPFDAYGMAVQEDTEEPGEMDVLGLTDAFDSTSAFLYVGAGRGDYKLTALTDATGSQIEVVNAPVYIKCGNNNDWLKEYVFNSLPGGDNEQESFTLEVETVRADEVTVDMVVDADLVYLESGLNGFFDCVSGSVSISDNSTVSVLGMEYIGQPGEGGTDMDEEVVGEILKRAANRLLPVIVDYEAVCQEHYKDTNYQYLARAFMKEDLSVFYSMINQNGNLMDNLKMNMDKTDEFPDREDNEYNYVNKNVYLTRGSVPFIYEDFHEEFDEDVAEGGFAEVTAAIKAENMTLPEEEQMSLSVSKARTIQYIIHYCAGTVGELDDLRILEIQPSANLSSDLYRTVDDKGYTKLYWKTDAVQAGKQILYSRKTFDIESRVKSAAQFNGDWEDINGAYDMVFVGLDGQRLNRGGDMFKSPVYNKEELKGKVYHRGDESGVGLYDANDITEQKMADLFAYMEAGYPVLVEDNCFRKGTAQRALADDVNTKYIEEETFMYRFLSGAVSDERLKERIYTVSDAVSSPMFMALLKAEKPKIELLSPDGGEADKVQRLQPDKKGGCYGSIAYEVKNNRGGEYTQDVSVNLYVDINYDGIFGQEELWESVDEDNAIYVAFESIGAGILPFKLEVTDVGNRFKRDSVQGYFEVENAYTEEIKVLQVTEERENSDVNLQEMFERHENSVLAYYLRGIQEIANVSLQFETVGAKELASRLEENAGYLLAWDVVVLTMDNAVTVDTVTAAITNYVGEGRSLLVCSQDGDGNRMGLGAGLLGQAAESRTYVSLGMDGASGYYRYAGLTPDMFGPRTALQCEQVNEGSIAYYPYRMEEKVFSFGGQSALRAADYLLACGTLKEDNEGACVTAWYTFGGTQDSAYGISPRDVRNNYYCYSKGNVVWLGQAHYPYTYDTQNNQALDGAEGSSECMLFANALMAAYRAGVHGPDVAVVAGFAPDSARIQSISVPFDQEWSNMPDDTPGILDSTVDVYFRFAEGNIAMDKDTEIRFYYDDPEGTETDLGGRKVKATPFESGLWTVQDNQLAEAYEGSLQAGKTYRIQAPVMALRTNEGMDNADIYVVLISDIKRGGRTYRVTGAGQVSLTRTRLFRLE